jgi:hypothetical protein
MNKKKKNTPDPEYQDPFDPFGLPRTIPALWDVTGWMPTGKEDNSDHNGTAFDTASGDYYGNQNEPKNTA